MTADGYPRAISDVTHIIERLQKGDPAAAGELLPLVYAELRKLAAHKMAQEAPGQTLQPTALVHEAWLRLGGPVIPGGMAAPTSSLPQPRPCAAS